MSEIEFLTMYGDPDHLVLYAGAAPGTHTNYLSKTLFPDLRFVLVDPARFDAWTTDKIEIRNTYFTDEMAEEFKNQKTIFISDIRSMDASMSDQEKESRVQIDMKMQMGWVRTIKPKATMLKFRLPYSAGKTSYFAGKIFFPIWGGRTTSETRLIVTEDEIEKNMEYDHNDYEDIMFHYNTITRTTYFPHHLRGEGLDHCYDCCAEIFVLKEYLRKVKKITDEKELSYKAVQMSYDISRLISNTGRTLKVV